VAREAGQRSKIAVSSKDDRVDAVGACVGHRGGRVQAVVNELFDEKIDIVRWSADNRQFITESLSPARVSSVQLDEEAKSAFVVVPDNQLSLAIGKAGQNVRLAARLTGWRIDIRSESQVAKQAFLEAAAQLASAPEDPEAEALLPPITFGDEDDA
jgi:N utilization substance protein A